MRSGFHSRLFDSGLYMELTSFLSNQIGTFNDYELVVCGHSLGGTLATLYGTYLASTLPNRRGRVFPSASPRVGNATFRDAVSQFQNLSIYRLVNYQVLIPRLPLYFQGFHHVGHVVFFNGDTFRAYYQQREDSASEFNGVPPEEWQITESYGDSVSFHYARNYLKLLSEAVAEKWPDAFEATVWTHRVVSPHRLRQLYRPCYQVHCRVCLRPKRTTGVSFSVFSACYSELLNS